MRPVAICVLVASLTLATSARAQVPDDNGQASRLFNEGRLYYEIGDFAAARVRFEAARSLRPLPELDYDIARCWDRLGHADAAVTEYKKYLEAAPSGPNAAAVRARVVELESALDAPAPTPTPPPRPALTRRRLAAPIAVGGAALLVAVVGTALVASVAPDYDRLRRDCAGACQPSQWAGLEARADAGYALWGVAGALAVADVTLWIVATRRRDAAGRTSFAAGARGPLVGVRF